MSNASSDSQRRITLFRGWLRRGQYVWSPYVTKVELRLRLEGIKYSTEAGSATLGPKGKIPYLEIANPPETTQVLADSSLIIKDMIGTGMLPDLNSRLTPSEKLSDLAIKALLEEKLYFYHTQERWVDNYYTMRDHVLQAAPYPVRIIVGLMIYRNTVKHLHGQGTGRLSPAELASLRLEIWEHIDSGLTESKRRVEGEQEPFWILGGREPTEADMTLFAFISSILICTAAPESQKVVKDFPAVLDYARRIHDKYFPDYECW